MLEHYLNTQFSARVNYGAGGGETGGITDAMGVLVEGGGKGGVEGGGPGKSSGSFGGMAGELRLLRVEPVPPTLPSSCRSVSSCGDGATETFEFRPKKRRKPPPPPPSRESGDVLGVDGRRGVGITGEGANSKIFSDAAVRVLILLSLSNLSAASSRSSNLRGTISAIIFAALELSSVGTASLSNKK